MLNAVGLAFIMDVDELIEAGPCLKFSRAGVPPWVEDKSRVTGPKHFEFAVEVASHLLCSI